MDEVKQHLAETCVAVSAVLSLSHALAQQIDGLLPTLHDKSAADAQALEEIASLMRREGSLAHLLARTGDHHWSGWARISRPTGESRDRVRPAPGMRGSTP
jgi:hypothetical protein